MHQKFLEKSFNSISLCSAILAHSSANGPRLQAASSALPRPRPQPGPGPGIRPRALSRLGCGAGPFNLGRPFSIGWPSGRFARNKTTWHASEAENPNSFSFTLSSLLSQSPSERQWREQAASPGAVAGPLAGVRAPQRVSAPPSSGLAAAPLWPDPGEPCPPAGLSFPRAPA